MADFDIDVYMADNDDSYAPSTPKILLQRLDNYQIYSVILCEYPSVSNGIRKVMVSDISGYESGTPSNFGTTTFSYVSTESFNNPPVINGEVRLIKATEMIAFQRFSVEKIPINFDEIANKINVKPNDIRAYKYIASTSTIKTTSDTLPNGPAPPNIQAEYYDLRGSINSNGINKYRYVRREHSTTTPGALNTTVQATSSNTYKLIEDTYTTIGEIAPPLLNMYALLTGYPGDNHILADDYPSIVPNLTGKLSIKYYRQNYLEAVPNVVSIDWLTYNISLTKDNPVKLPIIKAVFGTLIIDGDNEELVSEIKTQLSVVQPNKYKWSDYFVENIDSTINTWKQIHSSYTMPSAPPTDLVVFENIYTQYLQPLNKILSANNNYWNNDPTNYPDIDINNTNPQYGFIGALPQVLSIANSSSNSRQKAYEWHIKTQIDGSCGDLIMDSPRTIEIHKALNAGKYAVNDIDNTKQRVTDLGFLVERIAKVLGIRFDANGQIDVAKEKKIVRQVVNIKDKIDEKKIGVNCFGDDGIVVRRINNRFKNKDEIVSDQCVILQDIPDMIQEYFEQSNLALGLQESSAIEIKDPNDKDGKNKARFDNQLGLLLEMFNLLSTANEMTRANLISSLITQSQTSEVIAGLGLPSVTKTIPIEIDKKVTQLPYKGIAPHRSISQEIATCTYNVGIVLGQLL